MELLIKGFFSILTVGAALFILFTKNILDAAYALLVCLLGIAALFVFSNAEFMAASQIIIYVGGVLVLLIFGIVLSRDSKNKSKKESKENIMRGGLTFAILLVLMFMLMSQLHFSKELNLSTSGLKEIGFEMLGVNVFNLELIGVLLLMALVAATHILKDDK
jgi:NADH-quinone oxidoreductase subunit J